MIKGGFGTTLCIQSGTMRNWYISKDGVKRWSDNDYPCAQSCKENINEKIFMHFANEHDLSLLESEIEEIKCLLKYNDALRYDYLRGADIDSVDKGGLFAGKTPENIVINGVDLDIEIDDLMSK